MGVDTITLFLALLAILAVIVALVAAVSSATGDRFGFWASIRPLAIAFAAAIAVTATAGSLYLSEGAGYEPCRLCWVQRGFMYPAAVILVVAAATRSRLARLAGGALALIGLPVSIFHRYEQAAGGIGEFCDVANPCSSRWVEEFGYLTIPTMAGMGFFAIVVLVALSILSDRSDRRSPVEADPHAQPVPALDRS